MLYFKNLWVRRKCILLNNILKRHIIKIFWKINFDLIYTRENDSK